MSTADLDGWKKLIEEARGIFGHCGDDCMLKECRMGQRVLRALDSAVAHIGRLEAQRDEALEAAGRAIDLGHHVDLEHDEAMEWLAHIRGVLSRTEDGEKDA